MNAHNARLEKEVFDFLDNIRANRIKKGTDIKPLNSYNEIMKTIIKYFKINTINYNDMLEVVK